MSEAFTDPAIPEVAAQRSGSRALLKVFGAVFLVLSIVALALVVWIATGAKGGITAAAQYVNGKQMGRFGTLSLKDVQETKTGANIGELSLSDTKGEWLVVQGARFDWQPRALFSRKLHLTRVEATTTSVLRQPLLRPRRVDRPPPVNITIDQFATNLRVAANTVGTMGAVSHQTKGRVTLLRDRSVDLNLSSQSTAGQADIFLAKIVRPARGAISIHVTAKGQTGGVINGVIGGPTTSQTALDVMVSGDERAGNARGSLVADDQQQGELIASWDQARGELTSFLAPSPASWIGEKLARFGGRIDTSGQAEALRNQSRIISLTVTTANASAIFKGPVDVRRATVLTGSVMNVNRVDLAPISGNKLSGLLSGRFDVAANRAGGIILGTAKGSVTIGTPATFGFQMASVSAPIDVTANPNRLLIAADITGQLQRNSDPRLSTLGTRPKLALLIEHDRRGAVWSLKKAQLSGRGLTANATGRVSEQSRELKGEAEIGDISSIMPTLKGRASLAINLRQIANAPWQGRASVRGQRVASTNGVVNQLINGRLEGEVTPISTENNQRFGWRLKTGAGSAVGTFDSKANVPVSGGWELDAPLKVSSVLVSGSNGRGPRGDLAFGPAGVAIGSDTSRIGIGGWTLDNARFMAVGGTAGRPIMVAVEGIAPLGPAKINATITSGQGVVSLTDIVARHAGLEARGSGRSTGPIFDASFDLNLQPGAVLVGGSTSGKLGVAVRNERVGVVGDLLFNQAKFKNAPFVVSSGRLRAAGLLEALAIDFNGAVLSGGRAGQLSLSGKADLEGRDTGLVLTGSGNIAGRDFVVSQPLRAIPLGSNARLTGQANWGEYRTKLDGKLRGGGLDVGFAEVTGPNLSARVSGRLGGSGATLRGSAQALNLTALNGRLKGSARGDLTILGGAAGAWRGQLSGRASGLSVGNKDGDILLGANPSFEIGANFVQGRNIIGTWQVAGREITGQGQFYPTADIASTRAEGAWRVPGPLRLAGTDIDGAIDGTLVLRDKALLVTLAAPVVRLAGQSWTQLSGAARIADVFQLTTIPIEIAANGGLGPLKATVNFVSGRVATLQPIVVSYGGIEARGPLTLGTNGPFGTLQLVANPGPFLTSGTAAGTATLSQTAQGSALDARLRLTNAVFGNAGIGGLNGGLVITGPLQNLVAGLDASMTLNGQPASIRVEGRYSQANQASRFIVTGGGAYQGAAWRLAGPLEISSRDQTLTGAGRLVWREADLEFQANLGQNRLALTATLKDAPAALISPASAQFDGRISGNLTLRGQGQTLTGEARLLGSGIKPRSARASEAIEGTITADLSGSALTIRGVATNPTGLRATGDARLSVTATVTPFAMTIVRTAPLSGQFEIGGPVNAIAKLALTRNSVASGTLDAKGQLSGTFAAPQVQGRAALTDAALTDSSIGVRVADANAIINFLGPIADIETASATDGRGGKIRIGGRIALSQNADWRLDGQMERFQVIGSNDALIVATGPWSLASTNGQAVLGGTLTLDTARVGIPAGTNRGDALRVREVNRPANLRPVATEANATGNAQSAQRPQGRTLGLDVRLTSQGNARVVSRGFDGSFDLDVAAKGTLNRPQVSGKAELTRGRFDLAGRSFDMTKGTVRFLEPLASSQIDFVAERDAADITALAKIQGTLGRPVFKLESTPPSPQDEILARILFGRNVAALSLPQAAQLALGISSLTTGNQLDPTARLGQALGLERFSVGTDAGGFGGFTAGLRLVRDVYIEVTTGGEDGTVTMLEWRPRRRVQVQVTTNQKRESAVSVRIRSKD